MKPRGELVDVETAARACGVQPVTIRVWIHRGKLTRHGTRQCAMVDLAELVDLAERPTAERQS